MVSVASLRGEAGWAFVPDPLPPDIQIDADLARATESASIALGNLNGLGRMLPNPLLLTRPFVRREALASSRIEGTRADFHHLVLVEAERDQKEPDPDIQEVTNYMQALMAGWRSQPDRPFTAGYIMDLHQLLTTGVRGQHKRPGELRSVQVLIAGPMDDLSQARFVPPPASDVRALLDDLTRYVSDDMGFPALIRLALVHYQFETIHPFLDGNGRIGRLLMPLILSGWGILDYPLLYLSEYFERHRDEYIDHLYTVSQRGAWREWILFVLRAIERQANDAFTRSRDLLAARQHLRAQYQARRSGHILTVVDRLFERPTTTYQDVVDLTGVAFNTARTIVQGLVSDGVLVEATGGRRNQVFFAPQIYAAIIGTSDESNGS
jgi:Fic family protein